VLVDAAVQCELLDAARTIDAAELRSALGCPQLHRFLRGAAPLCEEALQQNELADVLADELAALAEEDGAAAEPGARPAAAAAGAGAGRSSASGLVELQSLSDLLHSKGRGAAAVQWHPTRRGVVAVACTQPPQQQAQQPQAGSAGALLRQAPPTGCILLWNAADAMHPEAVLEAPAEVLSFAFHPTQPHCLAAGLATGQVALFSLQQQQPAGAAAHKAKAIHQQYTGAPGAAVHVTSSSAAGKGREEGSSGSGSSGTRAALLPTFVSLPEACHQAAVTHLQWLPGAAVSRDGSRLEPAAAPPPGEAAAVEAAASSCSTNLFATTAADGSLLVWDMRISARQRKAAAAAKGKHRQLLAQLACLLAGGRSWRHAGSAVGDACWVLKPLLCCLWLNIMLLQMMSL
jgi:hypothetical protein